MPERAPTIVAGAVILAAVVAATGAETVVVSERDILHGAALAACRSVKKRARGSRKRPDAATLAAKSAADHRTKERESS